MYRHRRICLGQAAVRAIADQKLAATAYDAIVQKVGDLERRALALADDAERGDSVRDRAAALRELRSTVELLARLVLSETPAPVETRDPDLDRMLRQALLERNVGAPVGALPAAAEPVADAEVIE